MKEKEVGIFGSSSGAFSASPDSPVVASSREVPASSMVQSFLVSRRLCLCKSVAGVQFSASLSLLSLTLCSVREKERKTDQSGEK